MMAYVNANPRSAHLQVGSRDRRAIRSPSVRGGLGAWAPGAIDPAPPHSA
jgi:hypothetical protein